jgi:hypothetical protein
MSIEALLFPICQYLLGAAGPWKEEEVKLPSIVTFQVSPWVPVIVPVAGLALAGIGTVPPAPKLNPAVFAQAGGIAMARAAKMSRNFSLKYFIMH